MTTPPVINPNATAPVDTSSQTDYSCCLAKLKNKICDVVHSRWTLIAVVGLALGAAVTIATNITFGAVALTVGALGTWYFAPVEGAEPLRLYTMNTLRVLSSFTEFMGNYGTRLNQIKADIEECLACEVAGKQSGEVGKPVPTEANIVADCNRGATFGEVLPCDLLIEVVSIGEANGLHKSEFASLSALMTGFHDQKARNVLLNCAPDAILGVDNDFRKAAKNSPGGEYTLPIIDSPAAIIGVNHRERVLGLARALFTPENMADISALEDIDGKDGVHTKLAKETAKFPQNYRTDKGAIPSNTIAAFSESKTKLATFFFLHEIYKLHALSQKPGLIGRINAGKIEFSQGLGDPVKRAEIYERHLMNKNADVIFIQECETNIPKVMAKHGYISTEKFINQEGKEVTRSKDGSVILLSTKRFEPKFEPISYDKSDKDHRSTGVVATQKPRPIPTVLYSVHGDTKDLQVTLNFIDRADGVYKQRKAIDPKTQFAMGIDLNASSDTQMAAARRHLDTRNLKGTNVGITAPKMRSSVVTQLRKRLDTGFWEKDLLIVPKEYEFVEQTVAFEKPPMNPNRRLPDGVIPADHAPVGAVVQPVYV